MQETYINTLVNVPNLWWCFRSWNNHLGRSSKKDIILHILIVQRWIFPRRTVYWSDRLNSLQWNEQCLVNYSRIGKWRRKYWILNQIKNIFLPIWTGFVCPARFHVPMFRRILRTNRQSTPPPPPSNGQFITTSWTANTKRDHVPYMVPGHNDN